MAVQEPNATWIPVALAYFVLLVAAAGVPGVHEIAPASSIDAPRCDRLCGIGETTLETERPRQRERSGSETPWKTPKQPSGGCLSNRRDVESFRLRLHLGKHQEEPTAHLERSSMPVDQKQS